MMSGTEKGFDFREYFIQVEKAWNSPEMIMQRALKIANNTINQLETKIERDKPKIVFADAVATTKTSILVGELAKIIKQNGINIGQRRLFEWLRLKTDSLLNARVWIITCLHSIQWTLVIRN